MYRNGYQNVRAIIIVYMMIPCFHEILRNNQIIDELLVTHKTGIKCLCHIEWTNDYMIIFHSPKYLLLFQLFVFSPPLMVDGCNTEIW